MGLSTRQFEVNCKHRLITGQGRADICEWLAQEGMRHSEAEELASRVLDRLRQQAVKMMFGGGGLILLAIVMAGLSLVVLTGPVLVGVILFGIGLKQWIKLRLQ